MWGEIEVDIMTATFTHAEKFLAIALQQTELIGQKKAIENNCDTSAQYILNILNNWDDSIAIDPKHVEFVRSMNVSDNANDFEFKAIETAKIALASGVMSPQQAALAVWAPKLCRDRMLSQEIYNMLDEKMPIKSKQQIVCTFIGVRYVQTQYGESYVHMFEAYGTNLVIEWWTSEDKSNNRATPCNVILTCKVKDHSVFNGKARTRVTHCKF
jgi:hypothetical protein